MAKKNDDRVKVRFTSPRGTFKFPSLDKPDYGTDKFPKPDGEYKVKLVLDRAEPKVSAFLDKLDDLLEQSREEAEAKFAELPVAKRKEFEKKQGGIMSDPAYTEVYDEETEEPTGKVELLVKMKAGGTRKKDDSKWVQKPDLFDAKGKPMPKGVAIWGGTVGLAVFDAELYFVPGTAKYGVSRRLLAAQIFDLVSAGGQRSAASYGLEADEDGFDASDYDNSDDTDSNDTSSDSGSNSSSDGEDYDF